MHGFDRLPRSCLNERKGSGYSGVCLVRKEVRLETGLQASLETLAVYETHQMPNSYSLVIVWSHSGSDA